MNSKIIGVCDRVFNAFIFKIAMIVITLLTAVPLLHAYVGGLVKFFLIYGIAVLLYTAIRQRKQLLGLFINDKANLLLILFLISYAITVFLNRSAYFSENLNQLAYMGVFFMLMFIFTSTLEKKQAEKETGAIAGTVVIITFIFAIISFITFLFLINGSYVVDGKTVYYGMNDHRLWGLYNPNTGSMLCILSMLLSFGFFLKKEHKGFHLANIILQYICLLLTGSRSALYVLYVIVFAIALTVSFRLIKLSKIKKAATSAVIAVLSVLTLIGAGNITRFGLSSLPGTVKSVTHLFETKTEDSLPFEFEIYDLTRIEEGKDAEEVGGVLTGRGDLWQAGLKALKQSPIFGLGRENIPDKAEGYVETERLQVSLHVGGLHNIYITVLVASGVVGFALLAAFAVLTFFRWIRNPIKGKKIGLWYGILAVITMTFYITELVEARILYQVGIFYVLFWTFLGLLNAFALRAAESEEK